jgi:hypothetical protein
VLVVLAVCLVIVLVAVAGRVLLAAAVIAGIQWLVIHYLSANVTLVWVALGVPALLAGYTLADAHENLHLAAANCPGAHDGSVRTHDGVWLLENGEGRSRSCFSSLLPQASV